MKKTAGKDMEKRLQKADCGRTDGLYSNWGRSDG